MKWNSCGGGSGQSTIPVRTCSQFVLFVVAFSVCFIQDRSSDVFPWIQRNAQRNQFSEFAPVRPQPGLFQHICLTYLKASPLPPALSAVAGLVVAGLVPWQYYDRLAGLLGFALVFVSLVLPVPITPEKMLACCSIWLPRLFVFFW